MRLTRRHRQDVGQHSHAAHSSYRRWRGGIDRGSDAKLPHAVHAKRPGRAVRQEGEFGAIADRHRHRSRRVRHRVQAANHAWIHGRNRAESIGFGAYGQDRHAIRRTGGDRRNTGQVARALDNHRALAIPRKRAIPQFAGGVDAPADHAAVAPQGEVVCPTRGDRHYVRQGANAGRVDDHFGRRLIAGEVPVAELPVRISAPSRDGAIGS